MQNILLDTLEDLNVALEEPSVLRIMHKKIKDQNSCLKQSVNNGVPGKEKVAI